MNDQAALNFEAPRARTSDPETSHEAAADATLKASRGRLLVLERLAVGDATDFELAAQTGWQQTSIGKRRLECERAGLVTAATREDVLVKRPSPSGSLAIVWRITERGRAALENRK